ncbi:Uncharacterized protein FWK35_00015013, partial [Aphis craccivora]
VLRKNSRFFLIVFWFFPALLKTIRKFKNDLPNALDSFFYRKPSPKFEIEALFRHVLMYTDTKKKNTQHCKINTFIAPLRI